MIGSIWFGKESERVVMGRFAIVSNTWLMVLFSFLSYCSLYRLRLSVDYVFGGKPLPLISQFALSNTWICAFVALLWWGVCLYLHWRFSKRAIPTDLLVAHLSITLVVGIFMLAFFYLAGAIPFISLFGRMG